jgi:hypothetical protein
MRVVRVSEGVRVRVQMSEVRVRVVRGVGESESE